MNHSSGSDGFTQRVWIVAGVFAATCILLAIFWLAFELLLMAFAGLLVALFFLIPADWLARHSFLSPRWALTIVLLLFLGLIGLFGYTFASSVKEQLQELSKLVPDTWAQIEQRLRSNGLLSQLMDRMQSESSPGQMLGSLFTRASQFFSSTLGFLVNVVVIAFVGLFVAFEPDPYRRLLVQLFPPEKRRRVVLVLQAVITKLSWWIVGRIASMLVVGLLTGVGLWLLGVPMAMSLGLLAAILEFVPNFGPALAAIPALLVAYSAESVSLPYVALLYIVIQTLESYLITPFIQRQAIQIPPALLVVLQVGFGLYAGVLGLMMAAPLAAVLLVLVKQLYVQDYLGEDPRDYPVKNGS